MACHHCSWLWVKGICHIVSKATWWGTLLLEAGAGPTKNQPAHLLRPGQSLQNQVGLKPLLGGSCHHPWTPLAHSPVAEQMDVLSLGGTTTCPGREAKKADLLGRQGWL